MSVKTRFLIAFSVAALVPTLAAASSEDAWEEMRADVSAKCLEVAAGYMEAPEAIVDPFGSEKFGLAVVTGKATGADDRVAYICVYDKQTHAVELGSELSGDTLKTLAK